MLRSSKDSEVLDCFSDTSCGDRRSEHQLLDMDLEHNGKVGGARRPSPVIRLWKVPLPVRRNQLVSDLVKNLACLLTFT